MVMIIRRAGITDERNKPALSETGVYSIPSIDASFTETLSKAREPGINVSLPSCNYFVQNLLFSSSSRALLVFEKHV